MPIPNLRKEAYPKANRTVIPLTMIQEITDDKYLTLSPDQI
jgi:hypothetical protein